MDEDTKARLRWYRLILETLDVRGFAQAMGMLSSTELNTCLRAAIEIEAWRAAMPQYEYRDGAIKRTLESMPPTGAVSH